MFYYRLQPVHAYKFSGRVILFREFNYSLQIPIHVVHYAVCLVNTKDCTSQKNTSATAGDNINRIIEMAVGLDKYAKDTQTKIENLQESIKTGEAELAAPFPQQVEFERLSLRSSELTHLLNEDANSSENEKVNLQTEQQRRIQYILNNEPETSCEKAFFIFAKKQISENIWTESLDKVAITSLLDEGFSKDNVSRTILKYNPKMLTICTQQGKYSSHSWRIH